MNRKLRTACWVLAFGCLFIPVFPDPPLHSGAYVQLVTARSATVCKIEPNARALALELTAADGTTVASKPLTDPRRRHAFALDGLEPATTYRYEVRDSEGGVVDSGELTTAPASGPASDGTPVHFAVLGDSGGMPWWIWMQNDPLFYAVARYDLLPCRSSVVNVAERLTASRPDLWFHVGDVIYHEGQHKHYGPGFFRPFADLLRRAPCYAVLGNHDIVEDGGRQMLHNLHLPTNEVTGDERYFSVSWGPVRFLGLDLNHELTAESPALEFLRLDLADSAEPWRIAFAHFPPYSASDQGDRIDLIKHLVPALHEHGIDLLFVGHDHNYQRFGNPAAEPPDAVIVVTGGGGKSLYEIVEHDALQASHKGYHFCSVHVDGRRLRVEAIDTDGGVHDPFELDLGRHTRAPGWQPATDPRHKRIQALLQAKPGKAKPGN